MTQRSTVDLTRLLSDEHLAYLQTLPGRMSQYAGFTMKAGDDDDDDDGPDGDDDDDDNEDEDTDPETVVKVNGKDIKVGDFQRLMAREKRQGKRSGQAALATELGFDSIEALKTAVAQAKPAKKTKKAADDDGDDEAAEAARAREEKAAERERTADQKARRADLRGALREFGVAREDLDDAYAILDREVDAEYDDDDIEDAIEKIRTTRAGKAIFEADDDDADDKQEPKKKAARLPNGRGPKGRQKGQQPVFGKGGLDRARERGWIKTDA